MLDAISTLIRGNICVLSKIQVTRYDPLTILILETISLEYWIYIQLKPKNCLPKNCLFFSKTRFWANQKLSLLFHIRKICSHFQKNLAFFSHFAPWNDSKMRAGKWASVPYSLSHLSHLLNYSNKIETYVCPLNQA